MLPVVTAYIVWVLLWGSTWAAIKVGVSSVPPFVFAFERAFAVSVLLTLLSFVMGLRFPRDRRTVVAAAVVGVINTGSSWAIIFWSEQYVPSGLVSVLGAAGPIWTAVLAHFLVRGDRLSQRKVIGLASGLAGIVVLVGSPELTSRTETLVAAGLLALMPISWAVATILQVRALREGSPLPLVAVGTWFGTLVLVPFALAQSAEPQRWTPDVVLAFGYLVVLGSCLGLVLQLWLARRVRPTTLQLGQLLISVQALVIGGLALGEAITWRTVVGAALVGGALVLNALAGAERPAPSMAAAVPGE